MHEACFFFPFAFACSLCLSVQRQLSVGHTGGRDPSSPPGHDVGVKTSLWNVEQRMHVCSKTSQGVDNRWAIQPVTLVG